jgi:membrane protease YdiL (CAAX protease family)
LTRRRGIIDSMKRFRLPSAEDIAVVAWAAALLASSLTLILWRELASGEPSWWHWVPAAGLTILLALTYVSGATRPLRGYVVILGLTFFLGFGGGWRWGLIPLVRSSPLWIDGVKRAPWAISAIATHLLRLTPALSVLTFLLVRGRSLRDVFLARGDIGAPALPSRLLGMKSPKPWTRLGSTFAVVFCAGTLSFLVLVTRPSPDMLLRALPLLPASLLIAALNAFNEEFLLRAAPLSELVPAVGERQALLITTAFFGLGHFYGIPNGVVGVALSGFLGWFLGKSILETRGFFWAWLIHFLQDVIIFTFLAMQA